ncbi:MULTISPECIES: helix-turn-helix domain-containing protein [unclassified Marinomonas]|uniref:helix-turn-helix domain-containing protein n=1 Tax=unclassified Marinomonas TaxID=196814 RepID=UPI0007AF0FC8|nr:MULTISPECIES: helix-turn-helix transcriptional regulator [unclassified Marinomonas]
MTLAEKLTELRVAKNVSLQTVADAVGVSKPHIWELEKGKAKNPSLELLKKLAVYYVTSLDDLVGIGKKQDNDDLQVMFREFDTKNLTPKDLDVIKQALKMAMALIDTEKNKEGT